MTLDVTLDRLRFLHTELSEKADQDAVQSAILQLSSMKSLTDNVLAMLVKKREWSVPLSDGVRAEVAIYGDPTVAHVRAFAKLFGHIAECYQAPQTTPEIPQAPAGRDEKANEKNSCEGRFVKS